MEVLRQNQASGERHKNAGAAAPPYAGWVVPKKLNRPGRTSTRDQKILLPDRAAS
ncbi:hypothetical protein GCM10023322_50870 [Rugosimonospora acidiphila]|uniref:Uncharacterized protein n=1 Tax=Rugosimonospora acidiphila TaxID=556531 RepID=A0ABP9S7J8_9ACTN